MPRTTTILRVAGDRLDAGDLRMLQDVQPVFLTNHCGEAAHGDARLLDALGLSRPGHTALGAMVPGSGRVPPRTRPPGRDRRPRQVGGPCTCPRTGRAWRDYVDRLHTAPRKAEAIGRTFATCQQGT
jgi:hypothetical protein